MLLTCFISLLYFLPCLYIVKITYDRQAKQMQGGQMFMDWLAMLVTASENNVFGVIASVLIHAQIYMGIFGLQMVTISTK